MRIRVVVNGKERWLHSQYDLEKWLEESGTSIEELSEALSDYEEYDNQIERLKDCIEEQEMIADGHLQDLNMLTEELSAIADKLRSGKSGKGYTKLDLANAIDYALRCVSSI